MKKVIVVRPDRLRELSYTKSKACKIQARQNFENFNTNNLTESLDLTQNSKLNSTLELENH